MEGGGGELNMTTLFLFVKTIEKVKSGVYGVVSPPMPLIHPCKNLVLVVNLFLNKGVDTFNPPHQN